MKRISILICLLMSAVMVMADDKKVDYQTYSKQIRDWVWGMDLPQFKNYKLPAEYASKSSVVLARYTEVSTSTTASFRGYGLMTIFGGFGVDRGVNLGKLVRQTVYINDKAALDEYSEYDFHSQSLNKYWNGHVSKSSKRVLGAKIIKKSGEVKIVDIDEGATLEVSDDKVTRVAIPGLSVGDVLDVFAFEYSEYVNTGVEPIYIDFGGDEPVLNTQVHCVFDKDLNVRYRHFNGAPKMTRSIDKDGNYIFDLQTSVTGKKHPKRFFVAAEQIPYIEIDLTRLKSNRGIMGINAPKYALKEGVFEDPDPVDVVKEMLDRVNTYYWRVPHNLGLSPKPRGVISDIIKKNPKMSGTEKAEVFYAVLAMCYGPGTIFEGNSNEYDMMTSMIFWLRDYDVKYQVGVTTSRYNESVDKLFNLSPATFVIHVEDGDGYFVMPREGILQNGSYVPAAYQGRKAYFAPYGSRDGQEDNDKFTLVTLPLSTPADNSSVNVVKASIDGRRMNIVYNASLKGYSKVGKQNGLMTHFQLDSAFRAMTTTRQTYDDRYPLYTYLRKRIDYSNRYMPGSIKSTIASLHGIDVEKVDYMNIINAGVSSAKPEFKFEAGYTIDNMVFKAGDDMVIKPGYLVYNQLPVEKEEEERDMDIYLSSPLLCDYDMEVAIPVGYAVSDESLKSLNISVANDLGLFKSEARVEGSAIKISVKKVYEKNFAPASEWGKMKDLIKAYQDFRSSLVVLKKK